MRDSSSEFKKTREREREKEKKKRMDDDQRKGNLIVRR